jgi:hypothetical protein
LSNSSRNFPLKNPTYPFSHGLPGSINSGATASRSYHCRSMRAIHSGPLSFRICVGQPRSRNNTLKTSWTSCDVSRRWMVIARHSRVYSSTTVSSFSGWPSWVRSITKSYDQTWFGYSTRRRIQEPSANQSRPRLGCFYGTLIPPAARSASPVCRIIACQSLFRSDGGDQAGFVVIFEVDHRSPQHATRSREDFPMWILAVLAAPRREARFGMIQAPSGPGSRSSVSAERHPDVCSHPTLRPRPGTSCR